MKKLLPLTLLLPAAQTAAQTFVFEGGTNGADGEDGGPAEASGVEIGGAYPVALEVRAMGGMGGAATPPDNPAGDGGTATLGTVFGIRNSPAADGAPGHASGRASNDAGPVVVKVFGVGGRAGIAGGLASGGNRGGDGVASASAISEGDGRSTTFESSTSFGGSGVSTRWAPPSGCLRLPMGLRRNRTN